MRWLASGLAALVCLTATSVQAFCGFYVKEDDTRITSRASRVVLMRDGTTTVLSMQNSYEGPPEDFALIVPVPSAIGPEDVRTLSPELFDHVDELSSPRLVEYWEQEPICADGMGYGYGAALYGMGRGGRVVVEAQFAVGEYDVVILSAEESSGLERWLRAEGYRVPDGAGAALRPYVEQGFRFFAARVNAARVRLGADGTAMLSPLRIRVESPELMLPVRLGMLSSPGTQDLIVYVISREGRFEVANRENVFVPTNLEVRSTIRGRFGDFYASLLDRVWERHPGSVVTEYAWTTSTCDPCPGAPLDASDLTSLGGDLVTGAQRQTNPNPQVLFGRTRTISGPRPERPVSAILQGRRLAMLECVDHPETFETTLTIVGRELVAADVEGDSPEAQCLEQALGGGVPSDSRDRPRTQVRVAIHVDQTVTYVQTSSTGFTLTRLRYRYGRDAPATDLVFRAAPPVSGGTGMPNGRARMSPAVNQVTGTNTFQARYAILHRRRTRPTTPCRNWMSGGWGGPPDGRSRTSAARALSPGRPVRIEHLIRTPIPSLDLRPRSATAPARGAGKTGRDK
ncbi:MAG: DUF2330 domain-containing protein [Sandaracinaceae bacterium]|nr:DUF2330 domain-containing protein [Sandaracinaceae bacterium]